MIFKTAGQRTPHRVTLILPTPFPKSSQLMDSAYTARGNT